MWEVSPASKSLFFSHSFLDSERVVHQNIPPEIIFFATPDDSRSPKQTEPIKNNIESSVGEQSSQVNLEHCRWCLSFRKLATRSAILPHTSQQAATRAQITQAKQIQSQRGAYSGCCLGLLPRVMSKPMPWLPMWEVSPTSKSLFLRLRTGPSLKCHNAFKPSTVQS